MQMCVRTAPAFTNVVFYNVGWMLTSVNQLMRHKAMLKTDISLMGRSNVDVICLSELGTIGVGLDECLEYHNIADGNHTELFLLEILKELECAADVLVKSASYYAMIRWISRVKVIEAPRLLCQLDLDQPWRNALMVVINCSQDGDANHVPVYIVNVHIAASSHRPLTRRCRETVLEHIVSACGEHVLIGGDLNSSETMIKLCTKTVAQRMNTPIYSWQLFWSRPISPCHGDVALGKKIIKSEYAHDGRMGCSMVTVKHSAGKPVARRVWKRSVGSAQTPSSASTGPTPASSQN